MIGIDFSACLTNQFAMKLFTVSNQNSAINMAQPIEAL